MNRPYPSIRFGTGIVVCALLWCIPPTCWAQTNHVTIFVSAPTRQGFVDTTKDIQDSVKDVSSRLSHMKQFQVVEKRDGADIVLTVVARGIGSVSYGQRVDFTDYYGHAVLTSVPIVSDTYWVSTIMDVGAYRKEFLGSYNKGPNLGAWGLCADRIAKDIRSWAAANAEQLKQHHGN